MATTDFTLIDDGTEHRVAVVVEGGRVLLDADAIREGFGWDLKPQGLCRGDVCIPTRGRIADDGRVDLAAFADLLGRPLAVDAEAGAAYLGGSAGERGERLASLEAPDFTLPDLAGRRHSLSDYRGRKILLLAYASW